MNLDADPDRSAVLAIKVVPNASRDEIASWENGTLKVRIQSPPVDGKANNALISFLSKQTGISKTGSQFSEERTAARNGLHSTALTVRVC